MWYLVFIPAAPAMGPIGGLLIILTILFFAVVPKDFFDKPIEPEYKTLANVSIYEQFGACVAKDVITAKYAESGNGTVEFWERSRYTDAFKIDLAESALMQVVRNKPALAKLTADKTNIYDWTHQGHIMYFKGGIAGGTLNMLLGSESITKNSRNVEVMTKDYLKFCPKEDQFRTAVANNIIQQLKRKGL
jgi:hypothetical protein